MSPIPNRCSDIHSQSEYQSGSLGLPPPFIVSPYGPSAPNTTLVFDHSSILKMIEWAFTGGVPIPLEGWPGALPHRDRASDITNLACSLSFGSGNFLLNAGFEAPVSASSTAGSTAGVPRWVTNGPTPPAIDTARPHSGRQNALCTTNGSGCGIYQEVPAPRTGLHNYVVSFYAAASMTPGPKTDGLVGATASSTVSAPVIADGTYHPYTMTVAAVGGAPIRVWMSAGPRAGWVAIDDVRLASQ